jgi:hypothetical protein
MPLMESVRRTVDPRLTARRAVTASVASIAVVALIAGTPGSPYHPVLPTDDGHGPIGLLARLLWLDKIPHGFLIAIGFFAMIAAGISFLLVLRACERGDVSVRTVVTLTLAYFAAILVLPLLLSRDVFSYAYYGRILSNYGDNPYVATPANYPANDLWRFTWPGWRDTPSVYGPVFVWISAAITSMFRSIPDTIFAFRALAVGASLGAVWFVGATVDRIDPRKTAYAVAFIGLNPVVLFHTAGGGHVDALVMLAIAAALYLVTTDRELPATAVLTLGALVKVSAAVPLVLLITYVAVRAPVTRRPRVLATHIGLALGISMAAALPFLQSANPTLGMVELVQHGSWIAPPALAERVLEGLGRLVAGDVGGSVGVVVARIGMFAALAGGLWMILKQVVRRAASAESTVFLGATWGWALLLMMLFSPTLFPWYFCWVLPVAWMLPRVPRRTLEIAFLALCTSQLTTENFTLPAWMHIDLPIGHPLLVVLLVWFLRDLWLRLRHDVPLHADVDVAAVVRDQHELAAADPVVIIPEAQAAIDETPEDPVLP